MNLIHERLEGLPQITFKTEGCHCMVEDGSASELVGFVVIALKVFLCAEYNVVLWCHNEVANG